MYTLETVLSICEMYIYVFYFHVADALFFDNDPPRYACVIFMYIFSNFHFDIIILI